jgi:exodeoxyribonuclease VII large subunit
LIDLVADARAPTPTKAAEWAVPKYSELIDQTAKFADRLRVGLHRRLEHARSDLRAASRGLPRLEDLIAMPRQRFDAASQRLSRALSTNTDAHAKQLARVGPRLQLRLLEQRIVRASERLERASLRGGSALERVASQRRTRLERTGGRLAPQVLLNRIARARDRVTASAQMLQSLSYQSVLRRGFALVRNDAGEAVRSASAIASGSNLTIEFADGNIAAKSSGTPSGPSGPPTPSSGSATASGSAASTLGAATSPARAKPRTPPNTSGSQGSLF